MRSGSEASDSPVKDPRLVFVALSLSVSTAACGGGPAATAENDAGPTPQGDASVAGDAALALDASSPPGDGGSAVCTPTPGTDALSASCDLVEVAILTYDDAPSEVVISGRVSLFGAASGCAVLDSVDLLEGNVGSAVVQHLEGGAILSVDGGVSALGRAAPTSALAEVCGTDDPARRFEPFGVVIGGRVDGGTFQATCARADAGSHWPPALRVTCHHGVSAHPSEGYAMVQHGSFMGHAFVSTTLASSVAHGSGAALTSLDGTIHVIPQRSIFDTGAPLTPRDTTGWMGSVNESGETPSRSQLQAFVDQDVLGTDLCPPPMTPGPGYVPPPVFLARFTGQGQAGAYSTEVFVGACSTTPTP